MRIWSLHPKYLDTKGLVALWRETLLAKHVLEGKTKGYTNHPQLNRFKKTANPAQSISQYLSYVYDEAVKRGYNFNKDKIDWNFTLVEIPVTKGQLKYEESHLLNKLKIRDQDSYNKLLNAKNLQQHPMFKVIEGAIEDWEIL